MRQEAYNLLDEAIALMAQDRRDEAISRFEAALAVALREGTSEARATVARNAGIAYREYQQLGEAVRCFEIAVTSDPSDGRTFIMLAMLAQQLGNRGAVKEHLARALQIASESGDEELRSLVEHFE